LTVRPHLAGSIFIDTSRTGALSSSRSAF